MRAGIYSEKRRAFLRPFNRDGNAWLIVIAAAFAGALLGAGRDDGKIRTTR